jgi:DNA-binding transcriptional MerR regulator
MQETFNPSRAAKQVGIPNSTMRLWAITYKEFLSDGANPTPGQERRYTGQDIETLRAVAQMRHNGILPEDVAFRLRQGNVTPVESIVAPVLVQNDVESPTNTPTALAIASQLADTVDRRLGTVDTRLQTVDTRLQQLESQPRLVMVALLAFTAGVVLVAVAVWLAGMVR